MGEAQFDFRAHVTPLPDGRWKVTITSYWRKDGSGYQNADALWHRYGIDTYYWRLSRRNAERKAKKAIAALRRAKANEEREGLVIEP